MAEPFLGEIRIFSFNFAPRSWAFCNGQLLSVNQNQGLYSLIGASYGGDGVTNMALPNLGGRLPVGAADEYSVGIPEGAPTVTLSLAQLPVHRHTVRASSVATGGSTSPANGYLGGANNAYGSGPPATPLAADSVTPTGFSQAHDNIQPYQVLNFCIALQGIYPSPT